MFRRLATWLLLAPLSLNGLWMVCENAPQAARQAPAAATAKAMPGEIPECNSLCPAVKPVRTTPSICLVSSNGDGHSISVFAFALTVPPAVLSLLQPATDHEFFGTSASIYSNPSLNQLKPPPKN